MPTGHPINKRDFIRYGAALAAAAPLAATPGGARADEPQTEEYLEQQGLLARDVVYINANIATEGRNAVIGYRRAGDGSLTQLPGSPFPTGGTGFFIANPGLGPFDGDQQVAIDPLRGVLYAVNPGSNSVAAMKIARNGTLAPLPGSPFATSGTNPISIGLHLDSIFVLDGDEDPTQSSGHHPGASLAAFADLGGSLRAVPSTLTTLADGSSPSQALSTNTGPFTFVCEFLGAKIISYLSFAIGSYAVLTQLDVQTPPQQAGASAPPLPLGLWASPNAPVLYVGFATTDQLGVYRWDEFGRLTFLRTATNSGQAICWMRTADQGRRLYTINTGNNSISLYDTSNPEVPVEIQYLPVPGLAGRLVQFDVTPDDRFLYVIERASTTAIATAQGTRLHVFAADANGRISAVPSATLTLPVPTETNPFGVVAL